MTQDEGDSRKSEELGDSGRRASKPPGKQEDNARTAEVQTARDQGEDPSSPETGTSGRLSVSGRVCGFSRRARVCSAAVAMKTTLTVITVSPGPAVSPPTDS